MARQGYGVLFWSLAGSGIQGFQPWQLTPAVGGDDRRIISNHVLVSVSDFLRNDAGIPSPVDGFPRSNKASFLA